MNLPVCATGFSNWSAKCFPGLGEFYILHSMSAKQMFSSTLAFKSLCRYPSPGNGSVSTYIKEISLIKPLGVYCWILKAKADIAHFPWEMRKPPLSDQDKSLQRIIFELMLLFLFIRRRHLVATTIYIVRLLILWKGPGESLSMYRDVYVCNYQ